MSSSSSSATIKNPHFLARRIHSVFGFLPVGGFLLFHLWENSQSRYGMEHYNKYVVEKIQGMNYVHLLEIFVIALPILIHAVYGCVIWWYGKSNVTSYGYLRNWMWWFQRISGFGILAFLVIHVGWTRIAAIFDPAIGRNMFGHMQQIFSNPLNLAIYIVGMILAVVHLFNGLWTMGIVWGAWATERSQRLAQILLAGACLVVIALGIHGVLGFFFHSPNPLI
jgi:succinate dehydrogenase / fumarate reductase cytochrome b subunit